MNIMLRRQSSRSEEIDADKMVKVLLQMALARSTQNLATTTNGGTTTPTTEPSSTKGQNGHQNGLAEPEKHQHPELDQAQKELRHLEQLSAALNRAMEAKQNEVKELMVKISPFLSLDEKILLHLTSFFDESSLYALEHCAPFLETHPIFLHHWEALDEAQKLPSILAVDCTPRERGHRFVIASKMAESLEQAAKYHYNQRQYPSGTKTYNWPDRLYCREDFRHDFEAFNNDEAEDDADVYPNVEFFLRVSYRLTEDDEEDAPTILLHEGFWGEYADLEPWDKENYARLELEKDRNNVHMVCQNIHQLVDDPERDMGLEFGTNWMGKRTVEWTEAAQKSFMKRLSLTALACRTVEDKRPSTIHEDKPHKVRPHYSPKTLFMPHLLVATRGYHSSQGSLAVMPPRSYIAMARSANIMDCVNVALQPTIEIQNGKSVVGFRILIDWGSQDTFRRRKSSILEIFVARPKNNSWKGWK